MTRRGDEKKTAPICGRGDARHHRSVSAGHRMDAVRPDYEVVGVMGVGGEGGVESEASRKMRNECDCSRMRRLCTERTVVQNKQPEPKIKAPPSSDSYTHTHTNITPFKPLYKHYLYFVHTHTYTHSRIDAYTLFTLSF